MASESIVAETARRIFDDLCDPRAINRAADDSWIEPAWSALEGAALPLAWVPEALGGGGAGLADGFAVLREAGRSAAPLPVAETLLAGFLLLSAGIPSPKGAMSCGPTREGNRVVLDGRGTLSGVLRAIPFAKDAEHLAVLAHRAGPSNVEVVALVETSAVHIAAGTNLAGDALNDVTFDAVEPIATREAVPGLKLDLLLMMGAAARAMQMAGALEAILDLAVAYANERVAFGRTIAKFQAVQHSLARLAGEVAAALAAAGSAADAMAGAGMLDEGGFIEAASAKIRVGEAAGEGAAIAHQLLGAIGFTREHVLHRFTRRLWAWRDDFGSEAFWSVKLGRLVAAKGADALWPMLAAR